MDPQTAARRWADTWSRAWPQRDAEAIAALYADTAVYRSPAFRQPYLGLAGVRRSLRENLPVEQNIECWFGRPIVSGDRAAVEWWASWTEQGQELTFAGATILRFDDGGKVVEHAITTTTSSDARHSTRTGETTPKDDRTKQPRAVTPDRCGRSPATGKRRTCAERKRLRVAASARRASP